ncbi:DUF488 domain-containing protein [Nocardia terpenica]|uniref:MarR family transcriptional regulator n=1 Tax=Nocardia terpenica TaxID=455432 RepID=A0A291RSY9_9NOCA|nr:DUF488 family protein [Nocardia terpenica]ATL70427.1 MarR family transcriptional regulator [Nocardia terpenica]
MTRKPQTDVRVKRVYDTPDSTDGTRVLVDRLWPRGISKQRARVDEWLRDVAPTSELRRWLHADPTARWDEFADRYRDELDDDRHAPELARLRDLRASGPVTLLTAVSEPAHSHVAVLLRALAEPRPGARS